jgi:hypothetical protein
VREVLGEETNPSDWKVFYEPAGSWYGNDYPERFWVEATLEGATLEYSGGGLQGIYHGVERYGELIPDGVNIVRLGAVNSLADFGRLVERVKPPRRRGWRRR